MRWWQFTVSLEADHESEVGDVQSMVLDNLHELGLRGTISVAEEVEDMPEWAQGASEGT